MIYLICLSDVWPVVCVWLTWLTRLIVYQVHQYGSRSVAVEPSTYIEPDLSKLERVPTSKARKKLEKHWHKTRLYPARKEVPISRRAVNKQLAYLGVKVHLHRLELECNIFEGVLRRRDPQAPRHVLLKQFATGRVHKQGGYQSHTCIANTK